MRRGWSPVLTFPATLYLSDPVLGHILTCLFIGVLCGPVCEGPVTLAWLQVLAWVGVTHGCELAVSALPSPKYMTQN